MEEQIALFKVYFRQPREADLCDQLNAARMGLTVYLENDDIYSLEVLFQQAGRAVVFKIGPELV